MDVYTLFLYTDPSPPPLGITSNAATGTLASSTITFQTQSDLALIFPIFSLPISFKFLRIYTVVSNAPTAVSCFPTLTDPLSLLPSYFNTMALEYYSSVFICHGQTLQTYPSSIMHSGKSVLSFLCLDHFGIPSWISMTLWL